MGRLNIGVSGIQDRHGEVRSCMPPPRSVPDLVAPLVDTTSGYTAWGLLGGRDVNALCFGMRH